MSKNKLSLPKRVERAVLAAPENTAIPLTQAEYDAKTRMTAIALAMEKAKEELDARAA